MTPHVGPEAPFRRPSAPGSGAGSGTESAMKSNGSQDGGDAVLVRSRAADPVVLQPPAEVASARPDAGGTTPGAQQPKPPPNPMQQQQQLPEGEEPHESRAAADQAAHGGSGNGIGEDTRTGSGGDGKSTIVSNLNDTAQVGAGNSIADRDAEKAGNRGGEAVEGSSSGEISTAALLAKARAIHQALRLQPADDNCSVGSPPWGTSSPPKGGSPRHSFGSSFLPAVAEAAAAGEAISAALDAAIRASTPSPRRRRRSAAAHFEQAVGQMAMGSAATAAADAATTQAGAEPHVSALPAGVAAAAPLPPLPPPHSAEKRALRVLQFSPRLPGGTNGEPPAKRPKVPGADEAAEDGNGSPTAAEALSASRQRRSASSGAAWQLVARGRSELYVQRR